MLDAHRKVLKHIEANVFRTTDTIRKNIVTDRLHAKDFGIIGSFIRWFTREEPIGWLEIMESYQSIQDAVDELKKQGLVESSTSQTGSFDRHYRLTEEGAKIKERFFPKSTAT